MKYCALVYGDKIRKGDQVKGVDGKWRETSFPGHRVGMWLNCHGEYRRPVKGRAVGQHWLEVARERVRAGEAEDVVLRDYGYVRGDGNNE